MIQKSLKFCALIAVALSLPFLFSSCEKAETLSSEETIEYTNQAIFEIQERSGCGRGGCYEFVFPITIEFPDGTTASAEDYEGLRTIIIDWKEANPDAEDRPSLSFPLEVISEDGDVITIDSRLELLRVRHACRRHFGRHPHHGRGERCFRLVYPVTITFPNGSTEEVGSRRILKLVVRAWRHTHPDAEERPHLTFPIQVEMRDGTIVDVENKEALRELKDSCSDEG